jgi:stage II sporulation protein AA (anti-sigma F factor antagonist)
MYFTITAEDNKFIIQCEGSLNAVSVEEFRNTVEPFINEYRAPIIIDLAKVDYVSSAGIRAFLILYRAAMSKSPEVGLHFMDMVNLINISPQVDQILEISGLSESIKQWQSERDSL